MNSEVIHHTYYNDFLLESLTSPYLSLFYVHYGPRKITSTLCPFHIERSSSPDRITSSNGIVNSLGDLVAFLRQELAFLLERGRSLFTRGNLDANICGWARKLVYAIYGCCVRMRFNNAVWDIPCIASVWMGDPINQIYSAKTRRVEGSMRRVEGSVGTLEEIFLVATKTLREFLVPHKRAVSLYRELVLRQHHNTAYARTRSEATLGRFVSRVAVVRLRRKKLGELRAALFKVRQPLVAQLLRHISQGAYSGGDALCGIFSGHSADITREVFRFIGCGDIINL